MRSPTRRSVLMWGVVSGASGLAGCSSQRWTTGEPENDSSYPDRRATGPDSTADFDPDGWNVRPDSSPRTVPEPLECPDEVIERRCEEANGTHEDSAACASAARRYRQVPDEDDVEWGTDPGSTWSLLVDGLEFHRGEDVEIRLSGSHGRGVVFMYDLQVFTEDGWENLRFHAGSGPGRGFEDIMQGGPARWTLRFLEDGYEITFYEGRTQTTRPFVCPAPPEGRYQFVYWGTCDTESDGCEENDTGLAVAFDLVE